MTGPGSCWKGARIGSAKKVIDELGIFRGPVYFRLSGRPRGLVEPMREADGESGSDRSRIRLRSMNREIFRGLAFNREVDIGETKCDIL